ncbi:hypothetical protein JXA05_04725 [Candidatus Peregrinibacteria bacterium]|nr:hypothetical protein [Candidatus Peregrinibacteria bacterium]
MKVLIGIIIAFVLIDIVIVAYVVLKRFRRKISEKAKGEIRNAWKKLIRQHDYKNAIMEADKLLDFALGQLGLSGNLGGKLKKAPHFFGDLNAVWAAHKVRNNIAHQMNYQVDEATYKRTMLAFKQAFKDLKIF